MGLLDDFETLVGLIGAVNESLGETRGQLDSSARAVQDVLAFDDSRGGFDQNGFRAGVPDRDGFGTDGFRAFDGGGLEAGGTLTTADGSNPGVATGADIRDLTRSLGALIGALSASQGQGGGISGGTGREDAARAGIEAALAFMTRLYGFHGNQVSNFGFIRHEGQTRAGR